MKVEGLSYASTAAVKDDFAMWVWIWHKALTYLHFLSTNYSLQTYDLRINFNIKI